MKFIPFNADYAQYLYLWYHHPELSHYFRGFFGGASLAQCADAQRMMRAHVFLGIAEGDEETPAAMLTLADTDDILRVYKLGLLVDPGHQKQGYGRGMMITGLHWAFNVMNAHKVFAEVLEGDTRTIEGVQASGFVLEGKKRQAVFLDGGYKDEFVFSILRDEYLAVNKERGNNVQYQ